MNEKTKHPVLWTTLFAVVSLLWIFPIALVFMNSFKSKVYIASEPFSLTPKSFIGFDNYVLGINRTNLLMSFWWTIVVTIGAVVLILLCTSMCAWWIVRVNNWAAKLLYVLFLFNMIVP